MENFEAMKNELKEEIKEVEGGDIEDKEIRKRREWIADYRREFNGKLPDGLDKYYEKDIVKGGDGEDEDGEETRGKKGKDKKGKDAKKKGKKGGKKTGDGDDGGEKLMRIGPTEVVGKFRDFMEEYNIWAVRDESDNKEQNYDRKLLKEEIMPEVEKEYRKF